MGQTSHIESSSIMCSVEDSSGLKGSRGRRRGDANLPEVNIIIDVENKSISNVSQSPLVVFKQTNTGHGDTTHSKLGQVDMVETSEVVLDVTDLLGLNSSVLTMFSLFKVISVMMTKMI